MAKTNLRQFDPDKVARLDAAMWRAYYNHQFLKVFILLMKLIRTQLHLNWYLTFRLAYHSAVAAADYRLKKGQENYERVLKNLAMFYKILSSHSTEPFDYKKAAKLELEWWDIHRYPTKYKKQLEQSLAEAMAILYNVQPRKLSDYARYRAEAMMIPNHKGDKQKYPPNWQKIESLLIKSWHSAYAAIRNSRL